MLALHMNTNQEREEWLNNHLHWSDHTLGELLTRYGLVLVRISGRLVLTERQDAENLVSPIREKEEIPMGTKLSVLEDAMAYLADEDDEPKLVLSKPKTRKKAKPKRRSKKAKPTIGATLYAARKASGQKWRVLGKSVFGKESAANTARAHTEAKLYALENKKPWPI